jgi:hypothetical protein
VCPFSLLEYEAENTRNSVHSRNLAKIFGGGQKSATGVSNFKLRSGRIIKRGRLA